MRISDWSSDVCSSDLWVPAGGGTMHACYLEITMGVLDPQSLEVTTRLLTSRFDITCLLEKGEDIPILFSTRNRLEVWANSLSLELSPLYGKAGSNAVRVAGAFPFRKHSATMWVDFVWVQIGRESWRERVCKYV